MPQRPHSSEYESPELRRELAFRRAIESSTRAGVAATDQAGVQIYANPAFCEMVGWSEEELVGAEPPFVYWPREEIPRIREALEATLRGEAAPEGFELTFQRRDGTRFDAQVLLAPLREEESGLSGWLASIYDVSQRKRTEIAREFLVEAGDVLSSALDSEEIPARLAELAVPQIADWCAVHLVDDEGAPRPVAVAHADPERTALARELVQRWPLPADATVGAPRAIRTGRSRLLPKIPPENLEMAGQSPDHLQVLRELGLHSSMVVPLKVRGRVLGAISLVTAESRRSYDDADLWVAEELASRAALALDNARLLDEAVRAREEAERAVERFHFLLEASNAIAAAADDEAALQRLAEFAVSTISDYCVAYRYGDDETIERVGLAHRDPGKRHLVEALHRVSPPGLGAPGAGEVIRTGEASLVPEISAELLEAGAQNDEHLQVLRQLRPRSCILVPLRARRRILGALALVTDQHSDRRYTNDDLLLAQKLASRTALMLENAILYRRAQEAVAVREEVMSILSHDLKSPLQAIQTASSLLQDADTPQRRGRSLAIIRRSVGHMNRLIQGLLDAARLEAGGVALADETIELAPLFSEAVALFEQTAAEQAVRIEQEIGPGCAAIRGDRERLLQVLTNLLGNALSVLPEGGGIRLRAEAREQRTWIEVSDTGPGIPKEELPHLFDRFFQARRTGNKGAGLGLSIASGIVEAHGSELEVESAPGQGSSFSFSIPSAGKARREGPARGSEAYLLLVEDDEVLRGEVAEALEEWGYEVVCASNGREALDYLEERAPPGLILLDLMMPVMNGWELLSLLETDPRLAEVPVVVLSCVEPARAELKSLRTDEYLLKPVTLRRLLQAAGRYLGPPAEAVSNR